MPSSRRKSRGSAGSPVPVSCSEVSKPAYYQSLKAQPFPRARTDADLVKVIAEGPPGLRRQLTGSPRVRSELAQRGISRPAPGGPADAPGRPGRALQGAAGGPPPSPAPTSRRRWTR